MSRFVVFKNKYTPAIFPISIIASIFRYCGIYDVPLSESTPLAAS